MHGSPGKWLVRPAAALLRLVAGPAPHDSPHMRGLAHMYAFLLTLGAGMSLIVAAPTNQSMIAAAIYVISISTLFGTSAMYHRLPLSPIARRRVRWLDHASIYLSIAGSYTALWILVLGHSTATNSVLVVAWTCFVAGVIFKTLWLDAPRGISAATYVGFGCTGLVALPALLTHAPLLVSSLILAGALLQVLGAIVFSYGRPDPFPKILGYHEVFHGLVTLGIALQFVAVAGTVMRA